MFRRTEPSRTAKRLRPPPDYSSRAVQVRVLMLVAMLMTVLVLMRQSADPASWAWMWGRAAMIARSARLGGAKTNTLRPPQPGLPDPVIPDAFDTGPRAVVPASSDSAATAGQEVAANLALDADLEQILVDGWKDVWSRLPASHSQRAERLLRADRRAASVSSVDRDNWPETLAQLDELWQKYLAEARASLATLPETEQPPWVARLDDARSHWGGVLRPSLGALASRAMGDGPDSDLAPLQNLLRELAMEQVRDDAPMRRLENAAWQRMLDELDNAGDAEIQAADAEPASYLELYRQPQVFRGDLVSIRGTARLGYQVAAPNDEDPARRLYVLWVKPVGGPNAPYAVFCESLPPGFPELADGDQGKETTLSEPVTIVAKFFKRFAYPARQGIQTAPLLLAQEPQWTPRVPADRPSLPSPANAAIAAACLAVAAIVIGRLAFLGPRRRSTAQEPPTTENWRKLGPPSDANSKAGSWLAGGQEPKRPA